MKMLQKNKKEIIRVVKYLFSAGSSFVLDNLLFTVLTLLIGHSTVEIYVCTIIARIISSIYNYFINSRVVFENKNKKAIIGYFLLVIVQMLVSATLVSIIDKLISVYTSIIKLGVDVVIFVVNYFIQKEVIFK